MVPFLVFGWVVGGYGHVLHGGEGLFLQDLLSQFYEYSDAPLAGREHEADEVELGIFVAQHLYFIQNLAELVDVEGQPEILPEIFELAVEEGLKNTHNLSMQILGIIEFLLAIESGYFPQAVFLFFMQVELLLVLW